MRTTVLLAAALLLPAAALAETQPRLADTPSIVVVGQATEKRLPDLMHVRMLLNGSGATSDLAMKDLEKRMARALEVVKKAGVADADTESTGPDIEPLYRRFYDDRGNEIAEKRQPNGFRASYRLDIASKELTRLGQILPQLTAAEATIEGVDFELSDARRIRAALEEAAVADAAARARRQILAAGGKPGRILSIGEDAVGAPETARLKMAIAPAAVAEAAAAAPRDVTYALRPHKIELSAERRILMEILPE